MLALLLTGFAKSLICQYVQQLGLFYFVPSRFDPVREDAVSCACCVSSKCSSDQVAKQARSIC